jgi:anti-sigma B factor antagonist
VAVRSHPTLSTRPPILARRTRRRGPDIDLTVHLDSKPPWTVVRVTGEIDLFTAPKLREQFLSSLDESGETGDLLVDLTNVTFMDSTGLGVLIGASRRMNERGGRMGLVCTEGPVLRVLELTRLNEVFAIYGSVDDALHRS